MIFSTSFKKTLFISALGHIAIFSIFNFSFGHKIPQARYAEVSFWGAILQGTDLAYRQNFKPTEIKEISIKESGAVTINKTTPERPSVLLGYYLKPTAFLQLNPDKMIFIQKEPPLLVSPARKAPVIMFYPELPYHFLLYFKDRQVAHIELMYNIISNQKTNSIAIKRKISSGNLEADLLTMRYISHYLFIQQASFAPNEWQAVKIELFPKDDKH